jgi:hypothetical protein
MMRWSLSIRRAPCAQRELPQAAKRRGAMHHVHLGTRSTLRNAAACRIYMCGRPVLAGELRHRPCLANGPLGAMDRARDSWRAWVCANLCGHMAWLTHSFPHNNLLLFRPVQLCALHHLASPCHRVL